MDCLNSCQNMGWFPVLENSHQSMKGGIHTHEKTDSQYGMDDIYIYIYIHIHILFCP